MKLTLQAHAKLNLMLDILSKLPNGRHTLFMLMQSVSLADVVTVETNSSKKITVSCSDPEIPTDESNLAVQAAAAFYRHFSLPVQGLHIQLEKHIPHAAGLAGGSADAAAVIRALFTLTGRAPAPRDVIAIGSQVGADVPFCALGGLMLAQYTGTALSFLPETAFGTFVIVKPNCEVSTKEAYAAFDECARVRHLDRRGMLNAAMEGDVKGILRRVNNVFEQFIDVPERVPIKTVLRRHGATCACMSGSGPSVFGVFADPADAASAADELCKSYRDVFVCEAVGEGVTELKVDC